MPANLVTKFKNKYTGIQDHILRQLLRLCLMKQHKIEAGRLKKSQPNSLGTIFIAFNI